MKSKNKLTEHDSNQKLPVNLLCTDYCCISCWVALIMMWFRTYHVIIYWNLKLKGFRNWYVKGGLSNFSKRQVIKTRKNFLIVSWCSHKRFTGKVTCLYLKERSILIAEDEGIDRGVWWPSLKKKVGPRWLCLARNLCSITSFQDVPFLIKTLTKAFRPNCVFGSLFAHEGFGVT